MIYTNEEAVVEKEPFQGELNFDVYAKRINTNEIAVVEKEPITGELNFNVYEKKINIA